MTVVPAGNGLTVTVTKTVDSPLRVQIQGPNGGTDANDRWCAPLIGSGGFVPWSAFNTKCWDGSGTAYAKQPIVSVSLLVPGANVSAVPFAFCLTSLAEGNGGGGAGGAGGGSAAGADGGIGYNVNGVPRSRTANLADGTGWFIDDGVSRCTVHGDWYTHQRVRRIRDLERRSGAQDERFLRDGRLIAARGSA